MILAQHKANEVTPLKAAIKAIKNVLHTPAEVGKIQSKASQAIAQAVSEIIETVNQDQTLKTTYQSTFSPEDATIIASVLNLREKASTEVERVCATSKSNPHYKKLLRLMGDQFCTERDYANWKDQAGMNPTYSYGPFHKIEKLLSNNASWLKLFEGGSLRNEHIRLTANDISTILSETLAEVQTTTNPNAKIKLDKAAFRKYIASFKTQFGATWDDIVEHTGIKRNGLIDLLKHNKNKTIKVHEQQRIDSFWQELESGRITLRKKRPIGPRGKIKLDRVAFREYINSFKTRFGATQNDISEHTGIKASRLSALLTRYKYIKAEEQESLSKFWKSLESGNATLEKETLDKTAFQTLINSFKTRFNLTAREVSEKTGIAANRIQTLLRIEYIRTDEQQKLDALFERLESSEK
ncbi:hypothetical protein JKY72_05575 [Candidatus Gracilibacteria bacterium]|nr:hypothetical protein [Candidatus Gracilibacteria bacterium]